MTFSTSHKPAAESKGQLISKQNCRAVTSPKKQTKHNQDFLGKVS
jgi:hypothetical protein